MAVLTKKKLRARLAYDQASGHLTWIAAPRHQQRLVGRRAGCDGSGGYRFIWFENKPYLEHRIIWFWMTGAWPRCQIDHVNGRRDDNRWENLRDVSLEQQRWNSSIAKNNTSGFRGVQWRQRKGCKGRWLAIFFEHGKRKSLGHYLDKHEAAAAWLSYARKRRGKYQFEGKREYDQAR